MDKAQQAKLKLFPSEAEPPGDDPQPGARPAESDSAGENLAVRRALLGGISFLWYQKVESIDVPSAVGKSRAALYCRAASAHRP